MNRLLASGGQSIGASASVLPMNMHSWFPLGFTGLIPLLSKGLWRVFSSTTVWKHQFFSAGNSQNMTVIQLDSHLFCRSPPRLMHCSKMFYFIPRVFFFNVYWCIVDLQCCVSFSYTAKWISCTYTCIHSFSDSFPMWTTIEYWGEFPVLNSRFLLVISFIHAAAAAKSLQSCLTLCDPIDGSPLGSPIPGILQARPLEWVAISFSNSSVYIPRWH